MALTESQRNQIAFYKNQIEGYRKDLQNLKDQKKRTSDNYSYNIKSTKDPNSKRSFRQSKISSNNNYTNQIEDKKKQIDYAKDNIKRIKSSCSSIYPPKFLCLPSQLNGQSNSVLRKRWGFDSL